MTGKIHSFQSLGTLDGPGVRFVVFLHGCNLHCGYCHNIDVCRGDFNEFTPEEIDVYKRQAMICSSVSDAPFFLARQMISSAAASSARGSGINASGFTPSFFC